MVLRRVVFVLGLLLAVPALLYAATIRVPADQPTIQAGVYASTVGDTVLVAPGTYFERVVVPRRITLLSEAGAESTTIDAQGAGIVVRTEVPVTGFVIQGFRITGGEGEWWFAGGIHIGCDVGVGGFATIRNNIIEYNHSNGFPGGVFAVRNSTVEDNVFRYNNWPLSGEGASAALEANGIIRRNLIEHNGVGGDLAIVKIHESDTAPSTFTDNVIVDNGFPVICTLQMDGGGVCARNTVIFSESHYAPVVSLGVDNGESLEFANNIVVHTNATGVRCNINDTGTLNARCNDVWGPGPSYGWDCSDQTGSNGNISEDPLFCGALEGDYRLQVDSPCTEFNSPEGCGLIGALPVGCGVADVGALDTPPAERHLSVTPNPVRGVAEFAFPGVGPRVLAIFDSQGRLVDRLATSDGRWVWTPGAGAPTGVYFARLDGGGPAGEAVKFLYIR